MRRLTILGIILACFAVLCFGQRRTRTAIQRIIQLTKPETKSSFSIEQALDKQRNILQFTSQPIERNQIGQLAWAGLGTIKFQTDLAAITSPGQAFPIQLYLATQEGIFLYQTGNHSLEQVQDDDVRADLAGATKIPSTVATAGCDIIIAGSIKGLQSQLGNKARNYFLLEAGHIAQSIQLQAVSLGLGSTTISDFDARRMNRFFRFPRSVEALYIICVGHPVIGDGTGVGPDGQRIKNAAFIIPPENFGDEELYALLTAFNEARINRIVASTRTGVLLGATGRTIDATILVNQLNLDELDALIFIGGPGSRLFFNDPLILDLVRTAVVKRKIVAATDIAPGILANAGVLPGYRVTAYIDQREMLTIAGAVYTGAPVEKDRIIITGTGPAAAIPFATTVADAIKSR
jgi:protease I